MRETTSLLYLFSGYRGQFICSSRIAYAILELHQSVGANPIAGSSKKATGICGDFQFNLILN